MFNIFMDWMYKQGIEGTGLDILVIVVAVLAFIFVPALIFGD